MAISTDNGVIALTQADFQELYEQGKLICQPMEFETRTNLPEKISVGDDRLI